MNIDTSTLTFGITDDLVIVGSNPEMADMTNPNGNIEGLAHYIVAETPRGSRFAHNAFAITHNGYADSDITVERLERLVAHLNATHPALDADCWTEVQACYGSQAYAEDGWEAHSLSREIGDAVDSGDLSNFEADSLRVECGLLS
jgi:hypothetical protein